MAIMVWVPSTKIVLMSFERKNDIYSETPKMTRLTSCCGSLIIKTKYIDKHKKIDVMLLINIIFKLVF